MTRVLLNSVDAVNVAGNNFYTLQLPVPIDKVIYIDLLATTATGYLLQIDTWGDNVTSAGRLYWRYLDTNTNQRYIEWQTKENLYKEPRTLRELVLSLWETDSSPINVIVPVEEGEEVVIPTSVEFVIELMIYSLNA